MGMSKAVNITFQIKKVSWQPPSQAEDDTKVFSQINLAN